MNEVGSADQQAPDRPRVLIDVASPTVAAGLRYMLEAAGIEVLDRLPDVVGRVVRLADPARLGNGSSCAVAIAVLEAAERRIVWDALAAGARGLVLRDGPSQDLVAAVRTVHFGHGWISTELHDELVGLLAISPPIRHLPELYDLTAREREVLGLLVHGHSTAEMAAEVHLSAKTIKLHISNITRKLGVGSRAAAVARVTGHWTSPDSGTGTGQHQDKC